MASGHAAAAPPSSVMNSRRLRSNMGTSSPQSVCREFSLPQSGCRVLWRDLNCSEIEELAALDAATVLGQAAAKASLFRQ